MWHGGAWLKHRTLIRKNLGSNCLVAFSKFGQFHSLHVVSVHSLYKYVSGYRQWWMCERIDFAQ